MIELGELLRRAREEKGLTLKEISAQTRIQQRHLEALEKGDSSAFAEEVYLKGALRNYAESVGLNPIELLGLYKSFKEGLKEQGEPTAREHKQEQINRAKAPSNQPARPPRQAPSFKAALIALALLLLGAVFWISYLRDEQQAAPPAPDPEEIEEEQTELPPPPPVAVPVTTVEIVSTSAGETEYMVTGTEAIELSLQFLGNCWIHLFVDGEERYERTFRYAEELSVTATREIWVRFGNPKGARLTVNNHELNETITMINPHSFSFILR